MDENYQKQMVDVVGQNIESLIAILNQIHPLENFSVGRSIGIGDVKYRYRLSVGKEGSHIFKQLKHMEEEHKEE